MEVLGSLSFFVGILALILIIAWIVLPVAIIGTKPILREILAELRARQ